MSPVFLSANSYVSTTGNSVSTLVEQGLPITETEEGVYYAQINPELYQGDLSYEIQWYVQYNEESNINTLSNKFLINNYAAALAISVELIN
jgi:hypothetical protein